MPQTKAYIPVASGEENGKSIDLVPTVSIEGQWHEVEKDHDDTKNKSTGFFELAWTLVSVVEAATTIRAWYANGIWKFRFADNKDKLFMVIGLLCAMVNGSILPITMAVFGEMVKVFVDAGKFQYYLDGINDFLTSKNSTKQDLIEKPELLDCGAIKAYYSGNVTCFEDSQERLFSAMIDFAILYCAFGGISLVANYGQITCWTASAERQAHRIRHACLLNVLRQNIGWFDTHRAPEVNTNLGDGVIKIQEGLGSKASLFFQWMFCALFNLIISLYYGWEQTLVILCTFAPLALATFVLNKLVQAVSKAEMLAYGKAGAVAEEVLGAITTVVAFGGQDKGIQRYRNNLSSAKAQGIKKGLVNGLSMGFIWFVLYSCFGLALWYGAKLYREDDDYDIPNVITVSFAALNVAFALSNALPNIQVIATARGAAYIIFGLIDCKSEIDSYSEEGMKPKFVAGTIELKNVQFRYPARPDVKILHGLSFEARQGQTVALVGASGCGKTTVIDLLLRFYDPEDGKVLIDGRDVRELNVSWLRQNIGLVSQEPVLFHTTIAENIRFGKEGVTIEEIIAATKDANAYDFIMGLPEKFETLVGEQGSQLSGGQKQRLAIARALVKNPKILFLDEATSALDTASESIVQDALDKARKGRTTVVIAHRLSTIKSADLIIGIADGKVAEMGTHEELMNKQGIYYQLVTNQQADQSKGDPAASLERKIDDMINKRNIESRSLVETKIDSKKAEYVDEEEEDLPNAPFSRILKLNAPEWPFIALGCGGSVAHGCAMPLYAVAFSRIVKYIAEEDKDKQEERILIFTLMFVAMGSIIFFAVFFQNYMFGRSGEALTKRIREKCFQSLIRHDISYFNEKKNSVGALTTRLHSDASRVQNMSGPRMGAVLMSLSCMAATLTIVFIYGWKMALVILAFMPFMILTGMMMIGLESGQTNKNKQALEEAGKITVESIGNIRTVASLNKEFKFVNLYMESLEVPHRNALKSCHIVSLLYAFSQSINYFSFAASFLFGGYMVEEQEMSFDDVFLVFSAIIVGGIGLGHAFVAAPDAGKALLSARRVMQLLDAKPSLDYTSSKGKTLVDNNNAYVMFKEVEFHYPNRKSVQVLQGMTFTVVPGQTVALVGSSGCGKSTALQLLDRFYDCDAGEVVFDHHNIRDLNIKWLRQQIGIVFQEPILFDTTIAENIAYGDNTRTVKMDEIVAAARCANIHSFITALPEGYDTNVGSKGTQLSGGEKQRIAIARALVRNPKILLLDEATSALDTENEKIVQEALDKAREGRSCIVIAHRLSTVQKADKICVIRQGKVSESGNHSELMSKQGYYNMLVTKSKRGN